jgi:membrane fusion protein (multidrug efflux system)
MSQATLNNAPPVRREAGETPLRRRARKGKVLRPVLMLGGVLVVALVALGWWLTGGRVVEVDNAYVRAAKLQLATDVSGIVAAVEVHEGERVRAGQPLLRLDARPFEIALAGARASLAQVALQMEAAKHEYQRILRDIQARQAQVADDQANFDRFANLVKTGGVTRAEYDDAHFRLVADQAAVESLRAQAQEQLARLGGSADVDVTRTPEYLHAQAQVDEAARQLNHTVIRAPFDAIATQVEQIQPGSYLGASVAAFGLVATDDVWLEANPKETELTWVKPGDPVSFTVDTYPDRTWHGTVESIAPASGSEFSVLPAQNASGNWVKVVQRIPLRVKIDRRAGDPPLRAGMSVLVGIDTGHVRHLTDLLP